MPASTISVIIPNYNRAALIGETILNLLGQTRLPDEIIVVDDGSTDDSVSVIESFGEKVKLIRQSNQGPGAARNAGLKAATGQFIQFQDSDDLFSLNKLEAQARTLENSGADIVFSPWVKLGIEQGRVRFENHVLQQQMPLATRSLACWWLRGWSTVFQSLMFRRDFLEASGPYRTDLMPSEDSEYFFRMLVRGPKVAFTGDCLMLYRLHSHNKITQNEGVAESSRIVDWARCLRLVISQLESASLSTDSLTRWIFLAGVRKHLAYLRAVPGDNAELISFLSDRTKQTPSFWLNAVALWLRVAEQLRLRRHGSRWMPAYRASAPTPAQLQLIRELGYQVG